MICILRRSRLSSARSTRVISFPSNKDLPVRALQQMQEDTVRATIFRSRILRQRQSVFPCSSVKKHRRPREEGPHRSGKYFFSGAGPPAMAAPFMFPPFSAEAADKMAPKFLSSEAPRMQRSVQNSQRGWNLQPFGRSVGSGISPLIELETGAAVAGPGQRVKQAPLYAGAPFRQKHARYARIPAIVQRSHADLVASPRQRRDRA